MSSYAESVAVSYLTNHATEATVQEVKELVRQETHQWVVWSAAEKHDRISLMNRSNQKHLYTLRLTDGRVTSFHRQGAES